MTAIRIFINFLDNLATFANMLFKKKLQISVVPLVILTIYLIEINT